MEQPSNRMVLIVLLDAFADWLHADTPEAIEASYEFNKRGFYAR